MFKQRPVFYRPVLVTRTAACLALGASLAMCLHSQSVVPVTAKSGAAVAASYGKLPLAFEANGGQTDPRVRFLSRGNGYSLFLTDSAAVLTLTKNADALAGKRPGLGVKAAVAGRAKTDVVRMELAGASKGLSVAGGGRLPGKANYFVGNDPARWHSNVPTYSSVKYAGVYPGVDLVYYGNQGRLEYDFVVAPNADARPIRLHFSGASRLRLDSDGNLEVAAKDGEIAFHKPVVYQEIDGRRRQVEGRFKLVAANTVSFAVGSYERDKSLVIDPTLLYSTYLDGSNSDVPAAIAVDSNGDAYIIGTTLSSDFPVTTGAFQTTRSNYSPQIAFITKLNAGGTALIYSTFLGGSNDVGFGNAIAVDADGDTFVTGSTDSTDFPVTSGAFQTASSGAATHSGAAFVAKLNPSGSALIYSTYLGGSKGAGATAIAVNSDGDAYVTGITQSTTFPVTRGAFQTENNGAAAGNAFVTELNPDGSALIYSTYLGGTYYDEGTGIALDATGDAYVTGFAFSTDFPVTSGAFQTTNRAAKNRFGGGYNSFITKFNPTGTALLYSTYLGGSGNLVNSDNPNLGDYPYGIAVDSAGNAYVAGNTGSADFPVTSGAFQTVNIAADGTTAFVTKLNPAGSALVFSTYLEGSYYQYASGIALDKAGDAYVAGYAASEDFPVTSDAYQKVNKTPFINHFGNAFLTKFNPAGTALLYSSYLGGTYDDRANAIATDAIGDAYVTGEAISFDFPVTSGAFQTTKKNANFESAAFISKFNLSPTAAPIFSPAAGFYSKAQPIAISDVTPGARIYYTTKYGDTPTVNSTPYTGPFTMSSTGSVAAIAVSADLAESPITYAYYGFRVVEPVFSHDGGRYSAPISVSISDGTPGAVIHYTTNGSTPTATSATYSGPITVSATETVRAIGILAGYENSTVAAADITIY